MDPNLKSLINLIASFSDSALIIDRSGKILFANPSSELLFGFLYKSLRNKKISDLIPELSKVNLDKIKKKPQTLKTAKKGSKELFIELTLSKVRYEKQGVIVLLCRDVTGFIKQQEQSLKEHIELALNSEKLSALFGNVDVLLWSVKKDEKGEYFYEQVNEAFASVGGLKPENYIGKPVRELGTEEEYRAILSSLKRSRRGKPYVYEIKVGSEPELHYFTIRIITVPSKGRVKYYVCSATNITRIKQAEEKLRASEQKFRDLAHYAPIAFARLNVKSDEYEYVNEEFRKQSGYGLKEINSFPKEEIINLIHPEDRDGLLARNNEWVAGGCRGVQRNEYRFKMKNGKYKWLDSYFYAEFSPNDELVAINQIYIDITENKLASERLQLFAHALESSTEMISISDYENRLTFVNRAFLETYGYTYEQITGRKASVLGSPVNPADIHQRIYDQTLDEGWNGELLNTKMDGTEFPVFLSTSKIRDKEGRFLGMLGVARDITERKKAEEAVITERNKAQKYLDVAGVMLIVLLKNGTISLINKKGCEILGCSENMVIGKDWFENFVPAAERERIRNFFADLMEGKKEPADYFENPVINSAGELRDILWHNTILRDEHGNITGLLSSGEDITMRKLTDQKLKASLEEKEILLKEVYHRVKNNMQMIMSLLRIQSRTIADPAVYEMIKETLSRIKIMMGIHEKLYKSKELSEMDFSVYVHNLVTQIHQAYQEQAGGVSLKINTSGVFLGLDKAIPCSLLLNELITNIYKHAFKDGRKGEIYVEVAHDIGGGIRMIVQDNGAGIPENINIRNTESLGMQLVNTLTEQLGGTIEVDRTSGTKCTICF